MKVKIRRVKPEEKAKRALGELISFMRIYENTVELELRKGMSKKGDIISKLRKEFTPDEWSIEVEE